jgi:hypothetical protein
MASPFRTFRKNQKVWMAGVTIMAIIAFVFLGSSSMQNIGRGGRESAAIQTKYGSLTQSQINSQREQRRVLLEFVSGLEQLLSSNDQAYKVTDAVKNILGDDSEDTAIERWLYARTAESMGIVIDDKAVNDLLGQMTMGVPDPQGKIEQVLHFVHGGIPQPYLFTVMRDQLLAIRLMQLGHQYDSWAGNTATPGEKWDYFKRFHQKATVEVAVLLPSNYAKDIKDPTADDLKKFFEKYKDVEPSPDSPQPGFRVPRKVSIEYMEVEPSSYENLVTADEIKTEYDKDPKAYAREKEDFEKQEKEEREAREKEDKAAKASSKPAPESKPATEPQDQMLPTKPEVKPETNSPAKPAATSPVKSSEPVKPAPAPSKPSGTSVATPASPFRLVSYVDDKVGEKSAPAATAEKKNATAPAPKSTTDQGAVTSEPPADTKATAGPNKNDTASKKDERKPIKTAEERLNERIRKDLGDKKFREAVTKVRAVLDRYREQWTQAGDEKPKPPDFAALAKKYHMTAHRTGLVSQNQLKDTEFGKSGQFSMGASGQIPVYYGAFGPTTLFKVDISQGTSPDLSKRIAYFFWKNDDQPGGVPKWEDKGVEDKVRTDWKLMQAGKPAMDAAEDLKKKASAKDKADASLKKLVTDKKIDVATPPPFTWMTSGMLTGRMPAISEVGDLEKVGEDFMKTVFDMSPGQVAVATNRSKSEVYVIRMISLTPFKDLWEQFTSEDTSQEYSYYLSQIVRSEVDPAWRKMVRANADFKDLRQKDDKKSPGRGSTPIQEAPEGAPTPEEM